MSYEITQHVELPTATLQDVFIKGIAEAMDMTVEDYKKLFQIK